MPHNVFYHDNRIIDDEPDNPHGPTITLAAHAS